MGLLTLLDCRVEGEGVQVQHVLDHHDQLDEKKQKLEDVLAWLLLNSMRSERIQFNALVMQNVANVWRKKALRLLVLSLMAITKSMAQFLYIIARMLDLRLHPPTQS